MSLQKDFRYQRQGRYFISEPIQEQPYLCFVLHGHGHHPQKFLEKFERLERKDIVFLAPEGLHRYYLGGLSGKVGCSWMTKEERLKDIADYVAMLNQIATEIRWEPLKKCAVLGFSQGVATACRWVNNSRISIDHLIAWSGAFPPDLDYDQALRVMKDLPVDLLVGDQDEFISAPDREKHLSFLKDQGLKVNFRLFEGGHRIPQGELAALMARVFP